MRREFLRISRRIYDVAALDVRRETIGESWIRSVSTAVSTRGRRAESNLGPVSLNRHLNGRRRRLSALTKKLIALSATQRSLSHREFLQICQEVAGRRHAERLGELCCMAGYVLRYGERVYIATNSVQAAIAERLPHNATHFVSLLQKTRLEFEPLQTQKTNLDLVANLGVRRLERVGLLVLGFHWILFIRLTYAELSWDVVEPLSFMSKMLGAIAAYFYFLKTSNSPKYAAVGRSLLQRRKEMLYAGARFDIERYETLKRRVGMYERYLIEMGTESSPFKEGS